MNSWFETIDYFNPDTFDFTKPGVTVKKLSAALSIRGLTPNSNKKPAIIKQLRDYLKSTQRSATSSSATVNQISGGGSGIGGRPAAAGNSAVVGSIAAGGSVSSASTLREGFSLASVVKQQSDAEQLKRFLIHSGAAFDSTVVPDTQMGIMIRDSVAVVERKDFRPSHFVIGSELTSSTISADDIANNLFYLFSLSRVNTDSTIDLNYVDFVTQSGKRSSSVINVVQDNFNFSMSAMRLLLVLPTSLLNGSFVQSYGSPQLDAPTTGDPKRDGMRRGCDHLNGKFFNTSFKIADLPTRLLKTNMIRRLSEHSVLEYVRQTGETIDIKIEIAWSKLISMGESWDDETMCALSTAPLKNTNRLRQIRNLPCVVSNGATYVELLTKGWCRNSMEQFSYSGVSLQNFSQANLADVNISKLALSESLRNLECFLIFCFGEVYKDVTKELFDAMLYGDLALTKYSSDFIRFETEFMLYTIFQIIKEAIYSSVTSHDITSSTGVSAFLRDKLKAVILNITIERQLLFISTKRNMLSSTNVSQLTNSITQSVITLSSPTPNTTPNPPPTPGSTPVSTTGTTPRLCRYFFFNQLGVTTKDGNTLYECRVNGCRFPHTALSAITADEAKKYLKMIKGKNGKGSLPKKLSEKVTEAIERAVVAHLFKP